MACVIDWLNNNVGFTQTLLTLIIIAATLFLYQAAAKANRLTADSLRQALELEKRRVRPYVVFDLEPRLGIIWVVFRNLGASAAHSVSVSVDPLLITEINHQQVQSALTRSPISFLAPGRVLEDMLDEGGVVLQRYPRPIFSGEVSYSDEDGTVYRETFRIDLTEQFDTTDDVADNRSRTDVERIVRAIRELGTRLK